MSIYNRLHLSKICLCCFLDMHLYSNNLSTIATISSSLETELFPPCFSCNSNFKLSQSSTGSDDKNLVEIPEDMIARDSSIFIIELCLILGRPVLLVSYFISFANSRNNFLSCGLE